jgi:hypothetical protein
MTKGWRLRHGLGFEGCATQGERPWNAVVMGPTICAIVNEWTVTPLLTF